MTTGLVDDAPESTLDRLGKADPLSPAPIAGATDLLFLTAIGTLALLPFASVSVWLTLRSENPLAVMAAGMVASALVPRLLVMRFGMPSDIIRARSGYVGPGSRGATSPGSDDHAGDATEPRTPDGRAPVLRRAIALILDLLSFAGLAFTLFCVPAGIALILVFAYPLAFLPCVLAVAVSVAAFIVARQPRAPLRSPGLALLGLSRIDAGGIMRTVLVPASVEPRGTRVARVVFAAVWLFATVPVTVFLIVALAGNVWT